MRIFRNTVSAYWLDQIERYRVSIRIETLKCPLFIFIKNLMPFFQNSLIEKFSVDMSVVFARHCDAYYKHCCIYCAKKI